MYIAMDIGGTHIRYKVVDKHHHTIASHMMSTQVRDIIEVIEDIVQVYEIERIGISYAGQVNRGEILSAPNITISQPKIQDYFTKKFGIQLEIENDLKTAALAEYNYWGSNGSMVVASVGTGFGAAIIEQGKLIRGSHNLAGEIGHIPFRYSAIPCGCGNHYCIEASCSGRALSMQIAEAGLAIEEDLLIELKRDNSPSAEAILNNFHQGLLHAVGTMISLLNPKMIVLGGGVIHKNRYLLDFINNNIERYALPTATKQTKIVISELEDASLVGASLLIRQ